MKSSQRVWTIWVVLLLGAQCLTAQTPHRASPATAAKTESFAPFEAWKAAVAAGDRTALARLYSVNPPALTQAGSTRVSRDEELEFWAGQKSSGITAFNPKVLEISTAPGQMRLLLRLEGVQANGSGEHVVGSMTQIWAQQPGGWRIIASQRGEFVRAVARRLPQPAKPNPNLYPDPREAQSELKTALAEAARLHKRVLVVFGANWCYDCHVLDATFRSREFAPLVDANYVIVHINIGDEGKDNNDLAARLGVALDKGVPSLAILEPDGRVVVAQKHGEFESTVKIGPEDVRAFLEKWKPSGK